MSPDPTTRTCPVCWTEFTIAPRATRKHTYCSNRCRAAAGRRRRRQADQQPSTPPEPTTTTRPEPAPAAVRGCPHCGQPVTIVALLTTPEVARPQPLLAAPDVAPLRRV